MQKIVPLVLLALTYSSFSFAAPKCGRGEIWDWVYEYRNVRVCRDNPRILYCKYRGAVIREAIPRNRTLTEYIPVGYTMNMTRRYDDGRTTCPSRQTHSFDMPYRYRIGGGPEQTGTVTYNGAFNYTGVTYGPSTGQTCRTERRLFKRRACVKEW